MKYRDYAFGTKEIHSVVVLGPLLHEMFNVISIRKIDVVNLTKERYDNWIKEWRFAYDYLSVIIRDMKKDYTFGDSPSDRQIVLNYLRLLANTMLNTRQFVKDTRRGIFAKG